MTARYDKSRPHMPEPLRRAALIESGHQCSVAHCREHTYVELHHINGNREDNRIENVIILCDKHHKMAELGEIDRKALHEYKRINREKIGLTEAYDVPHEGKASYFENFSNWLNTELERRVGQSSDGQELSQIEARLQVRIASSSESELSTSVLDMLLLKHHRILLLGNAGSGKTVVLLSWLQTKCNLFKKNAAIPIYAFVSLKSMTAHSEIDTLVRSALGKHKLNIGNEQIEALLELGHLNIVFDGVNEIKESALSQGALEDLRTFVEKYPESCIILSSRFVDEINEMHYPVTEVKAWDKVQIEQYFLKRLGSKLGKQVYDHFSGDLDFEWLHNCSFVGLCSNPLTLWMIATNAEEQQTVPHEATLIDSTVENLIRRVPALTRFNVGVKSLKQMAEQFAYLCLDSGNHVSIQYEEAVKLAARIVKEQRKAGLVPKTVDAYGLLGTFSRAGLFRQEDEQIVWWHQIFLEHLSVNYTSRRYAKFFEITKLLTCPACGYSFSEYYEINGELWGKCDETQQEFKISVPQIPAAKRLKSRVHFVDRMGIQPVQYATLVPNAIHDERWIYFLPTSKIYHSALRYSQDPEIQQPMFREELDKKTGEPRQIIDLEVWALCEAEIFRLKHKNNLTVVHVHHPPINPASRLRGYKLVTLRYMSPEELEEEVDERIGFTSPEKEKYFEERRVKNLPIHHDFDFVEDQLHKVIRIAQKYGGQVRRTWGPFEEVIAEFPGEAWDFSQYSAEEDID